MAAAYPPSCSKARTCDRSSHGGRSSAPASPARSTTATRGSAARPATPPAARRVVRLLPCRGSRSHAAHTGRDCRFLLLHRRGRFAGRRGLVRETGAGDHSCAGRRTCRGGPTRDAAILRPVATPDQRDLYVYYSDHSHLDNRGVQYLPGPLRACGAGRKQTAGGNIAAGPSSEPGWAGWRRPWCRRRLRGDALFPQVTFVRELRRYVMVFNVHVYREYRQEAKPVQSGIYIACSEDGLRWSKLTQLIAIRSIAVWAKRSGGIRRCCSRRWRTAPRRGGSFTRTARVRGHQAPRTPPLPGRPADRVFLRRRIAGPLEWTIHQLATRTVLRIPPTS